MRAAYSCENSVPVIWNWNAGIRADLWNVDDMRAQYRASDIEIYGTRSTWVGGLLMCRANDDEINEIALSRSFRDVYFDILRLNM